MKNRIKTLKIMVGIFIVLTFISLLVLAIIHQTPVEEQQINVLGTYISKATYDYTAVLKPNTIYNRSFLKPGEGIIYTRITKQVNLTLTYNFEASVPAETEITYNLKMELKTSAWSYQLPYSIPPTKTNRTQITIEIMPLNRTQLENIKSKLDSETGVTSAEYAVEITPTFNVKANTTLGDIGQIFTPVLAVNFTKTEQGEVILIENLVQTKSGSITQTEIITLQDVIYQRYASYILSAVSATGLAISLFLYTRYRPPESPEKRLEKLISPYKDLIVETGQRSLPRESKIIEVNSIEEMNKIAEILAKPILLTKKPKPTLMVIDQNVIYEHKINLET